MMLCLFSGAFKTLDKDNSGTIDLDIKEVWLCSVLMILSRVWGLAFCSDGPPTGG